MIFGFAYLIMVIIISLFWVLIAILPKPDFVKKPLDKTLDKIRSLLSKKEE